MNEFAKPGLANDQFPPVSATDNGKVLTVADGKWVVGNAVPAGGGGVLVVHENVSGNTHTLDKTWQEIHDADFVVLKVTDAYRPLAYRIYYADDIGEMGGDYYVSFKADHPAEDGYAATSANGYPSYDSGGGGQ